MRPDEHKKKKNEAYKKKHGITSGGEEKAGKLKDKSGKANTPHKNFSGDTNKKKAVDEPHNVARHNQVEVSEKTEKNPGFNRDLSLGNTNAAYKSKKNYGSTDSSSDSGNDEETREAKNKRKTYKRREIVSNWNKYELEPNQEEEKTVTRGENYEKLISMAGKAMSHFRFKDELEWEQDDDELSETDNRDIYSQVLSINPADLIQSLSCIPVHQVLGISQDVFPSTQIDLMMDVAKKNKDELELTPEEELRTDVEVHEFQKEHVTNTIERTQMLEPSSSRLLSVQDSLLGHYVSPPENSLEESSSNMNRKIGKDFSNIKAVDSCLKSGQLSLQDEDLDLLLDLDGKSSSQEQGLIHDAPLQTSQSKTIEKAGQESDNLEDWLDSVLDD